MYAAQISEWNEAIKRIATIEVGLTSVTDFAKTYRDSGGARMSLAGTVAGQPYTLTEGVAFARKALAVLKTAKPTKQTPIPAPTWNAILTGLNNIQGSLSPLAASVQSILADKRALRISGGAVLVDEGGNQTYELGTNLAGVVAASEQVIRNATTLAVLSRAVALDAQSEPQPLTDEMTAAGAALKQIEATQAEIGKALEEGRAGLADIQRIRNAIEGVIEKSETEIDERLKALADATQKVTDASTTATASVEVITSKRDDITRMEGQAQEASTSINTFSDSLEKVRARLDREEARTREIVDAIGDQKAAVDELIADADKMLKGATVAGLASTFSEERKSLESSMQWAMANFFGGIILLTLTTAFLAVYVLNVSLPIIGHQAVALKPGENFEPTLAGVLSRTVILVGPFWMTLFAARRYRSLFDLRQQYSHKYNMAVSVEGFKKQAPAYAEAIATWVFSIVAASPLLQKPGSSMDGPPPTGVKEMVDAAFDNLQKVTGFATKTE